MGPPTIETERLVVRLPGRQHAAAMADYFVRNRDFLQPWMPTMGASLADSGTWARRIDDAIRQFERAEALRMAVFDRADRIIGVVNFHVIEGFPAYATRLGYSLDPDLQGQGLMREAVGASIDYVFRQMRMHSVEANYMPRNERSARLLRSLGFDVVGYARDFLLINGAWEDHVLSRKINREWTPT